VPELRELPNGDVQLGGVVHDEFIPFLTLSAGKIAQYVQRAQILRERADAGNAQAQDQIAQPLPSKTSSRGKKAAGGEET